jgi:hypothetical protein
MLSLALALAAVLVVAASLASRLSEVHPVEILSNSVHHLST